MIIQRKDAEMARSELPEGPGDKPLDGRRLGAFLRQRRLAAGYSSRDVAATAQVDQSWLSRLENGHYEQPSVLHVLKLCRVLDIEPADLFAEAGLPREHRLPTFSPYLRAKYDLPDEAIAQLEAHFRLINERYRTQGKETLHDIDNYPAA
jgi:transcriptional regulator with XRE-family HTH domain